MAGCPLILRTARNDSASRQDADIIGPAHIFRIGSKAGLRTRQREAFGMDARSHFKSGIEGWWGSMADLRLPPEPRPARDMAHSVAIKCLQTRPLAPQIPPTNPPSAQVVRKARERLGWRLDGS